MTADTPGGYILSVTSSEPDSGVGNGDLVNDTVMIPPLTVNLRAERKDTGAGRIDTILVQLSDGSQSVAVIRAPHDQSNH